MFSLAMPFCELTVLFFVSSQYVLSSLFPCYDILQKLGSLRASLTFFVCFITTAETRVKIWPVTLILAPSPTHSAVRSNAVVLLFIELCVMLSRF